MQLPSSPASNFPETRVQKLMSPESRSLWVRKFIRPDSGRYWDQTLDVTETTDSGCYWDQTLDVSETRLWTLLRPESRSLWNQSPEVYETRVQKFMRPDSGRYWDRSPEIYENRVRTLLRQTHADNSVKQCSVISEDQSSDIAGDLRSRYFCRSEFRHFRGQSQNIIERLEKHFFFLDEVRMLSYCI